MSSTRRTVILRLPVKAPGTGKTYRTTSPVSGRIKRISVVTNVPPGSLDPAPEVVLEGLWHSEFRASEQITLGMGVSSWGNLTAQGDLVQATGSKQPAYQATGFNGGPAVVGDGSNDELVATVTGLLSGARPYAWVVLQRVAQVGAGDYLFTMLDSVPNGPNYLAVHTDATKWFSDRGLADGTENLDSVIAHDTGRHLIEFGATVGGTACFLIDGVAVNGTKSGALGANLTRLTALAVGGFGYASARIAHIVVASDAPSAGQITAMRAYFRGVNFPSYTGGSYGLPS